MRRSTSARSVSCASWSRRSSLSRESNRRRAIRQRYEPTAEQENDGMSVLRFFMAPGAPTPVAPFSHAVEVDGWCFITGQMPTYPDNDSRPLAPGIRDQTIRVMENLKIVLAGL